MTTTQDPLFVYIHPNHVCMASREFEKDPRTAPIGVIAVKVHRIEATKTVNLEIFVSRRFLGKKDATGKVVKAADKWDRFEGRDKALEGEPLLVADVPFSKFPEKPRRSEYVAEALRKFIVSGGTENRNFNKGVEDTLNRMEGLA